MSDTVPLSRFAPELLLRAQGGALGLRAAVVDVDGVLTDGRLWIGPDGETVKAFHVQDGHGLKLLLQGGILPLVVSGRDSPSLRRRIADLGLPHAVCGAADKHAAASQLLTTLGLAWAETAVIGDDWPDLPLFAVAAFACAPADAHPDVRAAAHHVTAAAGGRGAVREFADLLLTAAGRYAALWRAAGATTLDAR